MTTHTSSAATERKLTRRRLLWCYAYALVAALAAAGLVYWYVGHLDQDKYLPGEYGATLVSSLLVVALLAYAGASLMVSAVLRRRRGLPGKR